MTIPPDLAAAGPATDLIDPPASERASPAAALRALEEPEPIEAEELESIASGEPAPASSPPRGRPRGSRTRKRKRVRTRPRPADPTDQASRPTGGHKPTKADLEAENLQQAERIAALETQLSPDLDTALRQLATNLLKLIRPALRGLVAWRGVHWEISEVEQREIADAWAPVLLPKLDRIREQTPLVIACTATALALSQPLTVEVGRLLSEPTPDAEPLPSEIVIGEL